MAPGPCAPAADVQGGWQITSYFGGRVDPITGVPGSHGGQDLAYYGCRGAELYAPSAGTLSQGWDPSGGGNWSGITLDDGSYIGIGHALSFAPGNSYRRVYAGELIAFCDSTGGSTGDHVHIAYRPAGSYYYADPYDLLNDSQHRMVGGAQPPGTEDDDMNTSELRREMTGQDVDATHKVYGKWFADNRKYHAMNVHDLRTNKWWILFGIFKLEVSEAYAGYWRQSPTCTFIGEVNGGWQAALIDNSMEIRVGPNGELLGARLEDLP